MATAREQDQTAAWEAEADRAAAAGDRQTARRLLAQVTVAAPDRVEAWLKLAAMCRAAGDLQGALEAVSGALRTEPLGFMPLLLKANLLEAAGRADDAGEAYGHALAQRPEEVPPHLAGPVQRAERFHAAYLERRESGLAAIARSFAPRLQPDETRRLARFTSNIVRRTRLYHSEPSHFHYPGLPEREFHDPEGFLWLAELEAATEIIRGEFERAMTSERAELVPYIQYSEDMPLRQWRELNWNKAWTALHLVQNGERIETNARHCPATLALLDRIGQPRIAARSPNAMFSLLAPHTRIPPHTGVANTRLVCHLPLIVPDDCWFRVGAETRKWEVGKAFVFDDTIEHEAANDSDQLRVVLIFDIWHPGLSAGEREAVAAIMSEEGGGFEAPTAGPPSNAGQAQPAAAASGLPPAGTADLAARRAQAVSLAKAGSPKAALAQLQELLAAAPDDPELAADAGLVARRCGGEPEVLPLVRAAADANPDHARIWQVLGLLYRALDDMEPAIEALTRAMELAHDDALIAHSLARSSLEAGKASIPQFERARRLAPDDRTITLGMLAAMVAEGRSDEVIATLRSELERRPDWVEGHSVLARHQWAMGDQKSFTAAMEKALEAAPRHVELWKALITALMQAGAHARALAAIERGRAAAGANIVFDANEAACQAELGNFERAQALFNALAPAGDPGIMVDHFRFLLRTGRPEEVERLGLPIVGTPAAQDLWPYLSVAWRMTGNPLWEWLEGNPRLVGVYDLGGALPPLDALAERLRALHLTVHQPLEQSLRGGTQTDGPLFSRVEPEIRALRAAVVEAVQAHAAQLPPPDPRHPQLSRPRETIRFSGSWSVRLTSGGRHANHVHPAGWFSSALYVALPDPQDRGPEPAGWLTLGEPPSELGLDLEPTRLIEPRPGRLALFPSTMWHGTRPFAEGERLTVAFDVAPPA